MFDALMTEFHIFPRFKEFVLLFGTKRGDNEIGLPQMRFRQLRPDIVKPTEQYYAGFGTNSNSGRVSARELTKYRVCVRAQVC